jgi:hypothetical protein
MLLKWRQEQRGRDLPPKLQRFDHFQGIGGETGTGELKYIESAYIHTGRSHVEQAMGGKALYGASHHFRLDRPPLAELW